MYTRANRNLFGKFYDRVQRLLFHSDLNGKSSKCSFQFSCSKKVSGGMPPNGYFLLRDSNASTDRKRSQFTTNELHKFLSRHHLIFVIARTGGLKEGGLECRHDGEVPIF